MLNFTLKKTTAPVTATVPTLAHVLADIDRREAAGEITEAVARTYRAAIRALARRRNQPVEMCLADLERFERDFPIGGFDPTQNSSDAAYQTWRHRTRTCLVTWTASLVPIRHEPAQSDDWDAFLAAIEPLTKSHPTRWKIAPQKLICLRKLAAAARAIGCPLRSLDLAAMQRLDAEYDGNLRTSHRTAARRLDEFRAIPELLPYLPASPIGFTPEHHVPDLPPSLVRFQAEADAWIQAATLKDWDEIAQEYTTRLKAHADVMRAAFGTYLGCALEIGVLDPDANSCVGVLTDPEKTTEVVRSLLGRADLPRNRGGLSVKATRKYLNVMAQALLAGGHDGSALKTPVRTNRQLKVAAREDKEMTPKNQAFCRSLLDHAHLRVRFLRSYLVLRAAAQAILDGAAGRELTPRERSEVTTLGACACFAAIEIAGAPMRVSNVREATLYGSDAWIVVPNSTTKPIKVFVPRLHTKARQEDIRFEIRPNAWRGHETILWYVREVRPLVPGAEQNLHLFPSPEKAGAPVSEGWFRAVFKNAMRRIVDLPMCPHQFRHGQASLLLDKHPGEAVIIAHRIGDTVASMLRFYAFLDAIRAMERGQDLMIGLMEDCA